MILLEAHLVLTGEQCGDAELFTKIFLNDAHHVRAVAPARCDKNSDDTLAAGRQPEFPRGCGGCRRSCGIRDAGGDGDRTKNKELAYEFHDWV